jgi:hypothetical protein
VIYLISCDLVGPERDQALHEVEKLIQANADDYRVPLRGQWLVETRAAIDDWYKEVKLLIEDDDGLLVFQVRHPYQGWIEKETWRWLRTRV